MGNSETDSTKDSMLEKITLKTINGFRSTASFIREVNSFVGDRDWGYREAILNVINVGLTFSSSIFYAVGRGVYSFEKKMGENDSNMNEKYKLSVKQRFITKYRLRKNSWN
jgi:hypothetical protein